MPDVMPILPSWDFDQTSEFYRRLGFRELATFPGAYLILEHQIGIELHFFATQEFPPERNDHGTYIRFATATEAQALYEEWRAVAPPQATMIPPREMEYGLREFALLDSMRNLLRVGGFSRP